jgi:hypothetical protein
MSAMSCEFFGRGVASVDNDFRFPRLSWTSRALDRMFKVFVGPDDKIIKAKTVEWPRIIAEPNRNLCTGMNANVVVLFQQLENA